MDQGQCCSSENPCDEGEGDCENDSECSGTLVCGINNCKQFGQFFHEKDDCCEKPLTSATTFLPKTRCQGRNVDKGKCCNSKEPCEEGEGNCENNSECKEGLVCGINNCKQFSLSFHEKDDCCEKPLTSSTTFLPKARCQGRNVDKGKCCSTGNPCEEGEGDCENDSECSGSLVCGINNCKQFGQFFHSKDDCCER